MKIQVIQTKRLGLQVYQVWICEVFATEFLSAALANTYAMQQAARYARKVK